MSKPTNLIFSASLLLTLFTNTVMAEEKQHRRPPHHNFTEEQRSCLEGKIGKPGEGERPSREKMEAAFNACGIQKPERPNKTEEAAE